MRVRTLLSTLILGAIVGALPSMAEHDTHRSGAPTATSANPCDTSARSLACVLHYAVESDPLLLSILEQIGKTSDVNLNAPNAFIALYSSMPLELRNQLVQDLVAAYKTIKDKKPVHGTSEQQSYQAAQGFVHAGLELKNKVGNRQPVQKAIQPGPNGRIRWDLVQKFSAFDDKTVKWNSSIHRNAFVLVQPTKNKVYIQEGRSLWEYELVDDNEFLSKENPSVFLIRDAQGEVFKLVKPDAGKPGSIFKKPLFEISAASAKDKSKLKVASGIPPAPTRIPIVRTSHTVPRIRTVTDRGEESDDPKVNRDDLRALDQDLKAPDSKTSNPSEDDETIGGDDDSDSGDGSIEDPENEEEKAPIDNPNDVGEEGQDENGTPLKGNVPDDWPYIYEVVNNQGRLEFQSKPVNQKGGKPVLPKDGIVVKKTNGVYGQRYYFFHTTSAGELGAPLGQQETLDGSKMGQNGKHFQFYQGQLVETQPNTGGGAGQPPGYGGGYGGSGEGGGYYYPGNGYAPPRYGFFGRQQGYYQGGPALGAGGGDGYGYNYNPRPRGFFGWLFGWWRR